MFDVILFEPEIPPNTGNVIRLCANAGCRLHLIEPLGFTLDDKQLKRAGLDYHEWVSVRTYPNLGEFEAVVRPARLFAFSTRGRRLYTEVRYQPGDALLFGPETRGLPPAVLETISPAHLLALPLTPGNRSLNLSNAVAVAVYEAWRQQDFAGSRPLA